MGKGSKKFRSTKQKKPRPQTEAGKAMLAEFNSHQKKASKMPVIRTNSELGAPGVPSNNRFYDPVAGDIEPELPLVVAPLVDALGRVNGKTYPELDDEVPDFLRNSAVNENVSVAKNRKVTIVRDTTLSYPVLCLSVFVQPDPAVRDDEARFAKMFARSGCKRAPSVLEADLVVFGGGSDVDPVLYGAARHDTTWPSPARDSTDMDLYMMCVEHGIPMVGICRGAQFLHVMNGGKLYQDVDNHYGDHAMMDIIQRIRIEKVSSVHHQMVVENMKNGMTVIATCAVSTERALDNNISKSGTHVDIEAFYYRGTGCLGFQGHPEYENYQFYTKWCLDQICEFVFNNPDFYWTEDKVLRMKPEFMAEQMALLRIPTPTGN